MRGNDIAAAGKIFPRGKEEHLDLRYSAGGTAFINFNLSCWSHKNKDTDENEYISYTCVAFGDLAENIAESLSPKDTIVVMGRLQSNNWEDDDGKKRYDQQLIVDEVGASLRWNNVRVIQAERTDKQPVKTGASSSPDEAPF